MRLIDAEQYRKEFLNSRDFEPMKILDLQTTVQAIPIPEGATNGDIIKAMFNVSQIVIEGNVIHVYANEWWLHLDYKDWWNAPYNGVEE